MSTAESTDYVEVLRTVRSWPAEMRLTLAEDLLRSLHEQFGPSGPRGFWAEQVRGLAAGEAPLPDDETVKQWVDEHRREKYG